MDGVPASVRGPFDAEIDAATAEYNRRMRAAAALRVAPATIDDLRAMIVDEAAAQQGGRLYRSARARTERFEGRGGPIELRILERPDPSAAYVYFHGGGWCVGQADLQDAMLERIVDGAGMSAISVEYRLAPEHPYPAPVDDAEDAVRWVVAQAEERFGTTRVVLGGDSAGATLALAVALRLREEPATIPVAALSLWYGAYDLRLSPSARSYGDEGPLSTTALERFFAWYQPDRARLADPDVSPLFADLGGLPRTLISVGSLDPLVDDSLFLHARMTAARVPAELAIYPGGMHNFDRAPTALAAGAWERAIKFLTRS